MMFGNDGSVLSERPKAYWPSVQGICFQLTGASGTYIVHNTQRCIRKIYIKVERDEKRRMKQNGINFIQTNITKFTVLQTGMCKKQVCKQ